MHTSPASPAPHPQRDNSALGLVLRTAKRLHRAATSQSIADGLPILRRLLAANVLTGTSLPQLNRERDSIQRKHLLRLMALEAGHESWETYRAALLNMPPEDVPHFDLLRQKAGYPNLWFSTPDQARAHTMAHGGKVVPVGTQAVVLPEN